MRRFIAILSCMLLLMGCTTPTAELPGGRSVLSDPTLENAPTYTPAPTAVWTPGPLAENPAPTWQPETVKPFTLVAPLTYEWLGNVNTLQVDADGTFWLINDLNVLQYADGLWQPFLTEITDIVIGMDSQRRVWTASYDGSYVSAWDGSNWVVYTESEGWLPIDMFQYTPVDPGIHEDGHGGLWVTTAQDVRRLKDGRWDIFTPEEMGFKVGATEDTYIGFNLGIVDGDAWVGECDWGGPGPMGGDGVRRQTSSGWQPVKLANNNDCATFIQQDNGGNKVVGMGDTVYWQFAGTTQWNRFSPGVVQTAVGEVRGGYVMNAAIDPQGRVWVTFSMCGGAACDTAEATYILTDGKPELAYPPRDPFYQDLLFTTSGDAWLLGNTTNPELVFGRTTTPNRGFMSVAAAQDASGQIWVVGHSSTQVGLWKLEGN